MGMTGVRHNCARATALVVVLALCWPTATALAVAAKSAPVQHSCCMRMSHACHPQRQSGDSIQTICHTCGWCHALPNARAGQTSASVSFCISIARADLRIEPESSASLAPSRLRASRAPPLSFSFAQES